MDLALIGSLVAYVILFLGMLIGFLAGLKRGLVKSSIRLGTFVVFLIIAGFISTPIASAISTIDISSFGWDVDGTVVKTIPEGLKALIMSEESISSAAESMPSLTKIVESLPSAIISLVVFFLLNFIMLFISWIVYVIIAKHGLKQSRLEKKAKKLKKLEARAKKQGKTFSEPEVVVPVKKKRRLLGSLVGAVCGFVFIFALMMPITSLTSTVSEIVGSTNNSVKAEEYEEEYSEDLDIFSKTSGELLYEYVGEDIVSGINGYSQSVAGKMLTLGGLDKFIFDELTSIKTNNEKFAFRKDIVSITKIYDDCVYILKDVQGKEYKNLNFDKVEKIVDRLFDTGLIKTLAPEAIPYAVSYIYTLDDFKDLEYKDEIKLVLDGIVDNLKSSDNFIKTLKSDFNSIISIGQSACKVGLVDDLVNGKTDVSTIVSSFKKENYLLLNSLTNNLTSSSTFKSVIANGTSALLSVIETELENEITLGKVDSSKVDWNNLESSLNAFLKNVVDAYLILDFYDFDEIIENPEIIASSSFSANDLDALIKIVGKELYLLKNSALLSKQEVNTYNAVVDYIAKQDDIKDYVDASTLKAAQWETETGYISASLLSLKVSGVLNYLVTTDEIDFDELLLLLSEENSSHVTFARSAIVPLLNSSFSNKPIKYLFEQLNANIEELREIFGDEVVEIDLSNFLSLSQNDKTEIANAFESVVSMITKISFDSFQNELLNTIFSFNDVDGGIEKSNYVSNVLVPLSKIQVISETYESIFTACGNNESFNKYLQLEKVNENSFNWEDEFEKINSLLSVLEKEQEGQSIKSLIFPNGNFESVEINNALISKIFKNLSLPLIETQPETTSANVLVSSLYESQILKQALAYLISTLNSTICETISSSEKTYTSTDISVNDLTPSQKVQVVKVFEALAKAFDTLTKEHFELDNLSDAEIVLIGDFLNSLKENAYNYVNGNPSSNCTLSSDEKTVENGGVFAQLYISMINYAKETYEFSGNISYGEIEWKNFLKTAQKLSKLSSGGSIMDILSEDSEEINVGEALEILGIDEETSTKIDNIQNTLNDIENSAESFDNLTNALDNLSSEDTSSISNKIQEVTGEDVSGAINQTVINNEKAVSSRISALMVTGLTNENCDVSLTDLCNGATVVLTQAINSGVQIISSVSNLSDLIDAKTTDTNVRSLVKQLFGIN